LIVVNGAYVALLDVLGFSDLVRGDSASQRLKEYLDCVTAATAPRGVQSVVFSDSIVLTAKDQDEQGLLNIAQASSLLMGTLLKKGIALRGAIAFGNVFRRSLEESVFVAGRAIVDAYHFERIQQWVGVMLTPSAVARIPDLRQRCELSIHNQDLSIIRKQVRWAAYIQPWGGIPFRGVNANESDPFDGFAVVPTTGAIELLSHHLMLDDIRESLAWLRSLAPSPQDQRKYSESMRWVDSVRNPWPTIRQLALQDAQNQHVNASA
jgi:hypothetical protein